MVSTAEEAIERSLIEWGVDKRAYEFRKAVISRVRHCGRDDATKGKLDLTKLKKESFPTNVEDAVRHVLRTEIESVVKRARDGGSLMVVHDKLDDGFEPFYLYRDERLQTLRVCTKKLFRHFEPVLLDPLKTRFSYQYFTDPAEYIAVEWGKAPASFAGQVMEAMVAHQLVHTFKSCLACSGRGTLLWYGGRNGAGWGDVICLDCKSMYEIKSKESQEKVRKVLMKYNDTPGGSYPQFCKYQHFGKKTSKKYLVLVNRQPESLIMGEKPYHTVTSAEIGVVIPKLTSKSFESLQKPHIGSTIVAKLETRKSWFTISPIKMKYSNLAQEMFDEEFGKGQWLLRKPALQDASLQTLESQFHKMKVKVATSPCPRQTPNPRTSGRASRSTKQAQNPRTFRGMHIYDTTFPRPRQTPTPPRTSGNASRSTTVQERKVTIVGPQASSSSTRMRSGWSSGVDDYAEDWSNRNDRRHRKENYSKY